MPSNSNNEGSPTFVEWADELAEIARQGPSNIQPEPIDEALLERFVRVPTELSKDEHIKVATMSAVSEEWRNKLIDLLTSQRIRPDKMPTNRGTLNQQENSQS